MAEPKDEAAKTEKTTKAKSAKATKAEPATEADRLNEVDQNPRVHQSTERDEEQLLKVMYGEPDADGVYGAPAADEPGEETS